MTDPTIDPERLAALLDGRLDEQQRVELLASLATSDEAFEAYVDAVAIAGELEETRDQPAVIPLHVTPRRQRLRWPGERWLALAAAIVGIALIPLLWSRRGAPDLSDPGRFVTLLEAERAGLPPGWNTRPWSTTRGAGDPLTPQARAVRVGARLTDLELAVRARDSASTSQLAAEIAALLEDVPASGPLAALYRNIGERAGESPEQLADTLERGRTAAAQLLGEEYVAIGAWAEAARVAAARRDADFFQSRRSQDVLRRIAALPPLSVPGRAAAERIHAAVLREGPQDWGALTRDVASLLAVLGS